MENNGFSLLEMMIVLFLLSILLSFAYPNYHNYILRAHRLEGQMALLDLAQRMEKYHAQFGTYADATMGSQSLHDVLTQAQSPQGYYTLRIQDADEQHFNLQAIPLGAQEQDKQCQILELDEQGQQRIASGPQGSPLGSWEACWT